MFPSLYRCRPGFFWFIFSRHPEIVTSHPHYSRTIRDGNRPIACMAFAVRCSLIDFVSRRLRRDDFSETPTSAFSAFSAQLPINRIPACPAEGLHGRCMPHAGRLQGYYKYPPSRTTPKHRPCRAAPGHLTCCSMSQKQFPYVEEN